MTLALAETREISEDEIERAEAAADSLGVALEDWQPIGLYLRSRTTGSVVDLRLRATAWAAYSKVIGA